MENKYYTPKIEEFHIGFEYEQIPSFTDGTVKNQEEFENGIFEKRICRIGDSPYIDRALNGVNANNGRGGVRVKYLDKEDIESLGFNKIEDDCFNLSIKEYRGRLNQEVRILIRQTILIYLAMDMNHNDKDNLVLFTGNIKNKSELIKLLIQLGIK